MVEVLAILGPILTAAFGYILNRLRKLEKENTELSEQVAGLKEQADKVPGLSLQVSALSNALTLTQSELGLTQKHLAETEEKARQVEEKRAALNMEVVERDAQLREKDRHISSLETTLKAYREALRLVGLRVEAVEDEAATAAEIAALESSEGKNVEAERERSDQ